MTKKDKIYKISDEILKDVNEAAKENMIGCITDERTGEDYTMMPRWLALKLKIIK